MPGSVIPTHLAEPERPSPATWWLTGFFAPVAAIGTLAILTACAVLLWVAPWPVDALVAVIAATAWTSWIDGREPQ